MNNPSVGDRRSDSSRNMVEAETYTVSRYYPEFGTCDLIPATINQRGELSAVPIKVPFGGSWEASSVHQPQVYSGNGDGWGNASRGPRWGMNFPVQPGDLALVEYEGAAASDPVIVGFRFTRGNYTVAWTANQVLSKGNDYTENTAVDDDLVSDRFDLLLPSGAWLRSTQAGSWVMATAPVDRPNAFFTLHADGKIKAKARAGGDYTVHLEFDPEQAYGRVVLGSLEDGSYIEFKDGAITLKAQKGINLMGESIQGDARPQSAGSAMDTLTSTPSTSVTDAELPDLVTRAAGEQVLQSVATTVPTPGVVALTTQPLESPPITVIQQYSMAAAIASNLISNPAIDGALRGRIGDLLTNPQALMDKATEALSGLQGLNPNDLAIGDRLSSLLGANAIMGNLGTIASAADITSLPMIQELGIPSWVGEGIQQAIAGGSPLEVALNVLPGISDNELLDQVCRFAGAAALNGGTALDARAALETALGDLGSEVQNRVEGLLKKLDITPLAIPRDLEGAQDFAQTAAQRLGRHLLRGNNMLGGAAQLFDRAQLGDNPTFARVASQLEQFAANPHTLLENVTPELAEHLPTLAQIPTELRGAIAAIPQDLIGRLPNLASGLLGRLEGQLNQKPIEFSETDCDVFEEPAQELLTSSLPAWLDEEMKLGSLLQSAPQAIQDLIQNLPEQLLQTLSTAVPDQFKALLDNPQAALDGLDTGMISGIFGGLTSASAGVFDVRVMRRAAFSILPQAAGAQPSLGVQEFHPDTQATPIQRTQGYGVLNMPNLWSEG